MSHLPKYWMPGGGGGPPSPLLPLLDAPEELPDEDPAPEELLDGAPLEDVPLEDVPLEEPLLDDPAIDPLLVEEPLPELELAPPSPPALVPVPELEQDASTHTEAAASVPLAITSIVFEESILRITFTSAAVCALRHSSSRYGRRKETGHVGSRSGAHSHSEVQWAAAQANKSSKSDVPGDVNSHMFLHVVVWVPPASPASVPPSPGRMHSS
jgi:hypothetical protein